MKMHSPHPNLNLCRQAFHPSEKTLKFLEENTYLIPQLLRWYRLEPFSQDFVPREIEVVYDGITFLRISDLETYFYQASNPEILKNYTPEYSEYFFDGEIAVFHCEGDVLIDRTQNLKEIPLAKILSQYSGSS